MYPLPEGCFAPRNQWYVAAWSKDVGRTPTERWILDEPVALYRRKSGTGEAHVHPTLAEDISATTYIEEMIQRLGHAPSEIPLRSDSVCVAGRRMFEDAIRAEHAGKQHPRMTGPVDPTNALLRQSA